MAGEVWVGIGLSILGLGLPAAVALLIPIIKILPKRPEPQVVACPIREHEARMSETERQVAVLQENASHIKATLIRIENKLDLRNGRGKA